jgi:putative membrane protein
MDTTPSDAAPVALGGRLHPLSWLFVLLTQLRNVALPLVALLVFGSGQGWELWGAAGAGVLAVYSIVYSFGFRYLLGAREIVVREGIFFRTERHVPYERIQNVVQKRNLLHRAFGVCELVLESAGSGKPEAKMSVITLDEAARIERLLRGHGNAAAPAPDEAATPPLLALGTRELVRLGLTSNRGAVAIGAAFAVVWQFEPWEAAGSRVFFRYLRGAFSTWHDVFPGPVAMIASALLAIVLFVVVLKAISVVAAIVQFHGFELRREDERVATVGGLFTRHAASARRDKIQRLLFSEGWLARRFGVRALACDVAAGRSAGNESESTRLKWLAPIATPAELERVVAEVAPGLGIDALEWRPLHPRAWRRMVKPPMVIWTLVSIGPTIVFGWGVLAIWALLMAYSVLEARGSAKFAGYALAGDVLAYRAGWLGRQWAVAKVGKGQVVKLSHSPFDRRAGMANVALDTAGASPMGFGLRVPYLAERDARALAARIRGLM